MARDVIFEFYRIGPTVKVTAVDAASMVEVSIVGPAASSEASLRRAALRKLEFVLSRRASGDGKAER